MLKRVKIQGYKSLADTEIRLRPMSVLFGPNAAGKSNFLDALQLLSRTAVSRTLKDAFAPPYRGKPLESFTFRDNGMKGLLARESASFSIEADVSLSDSVTDSVNRQIWELEKTKPFQPAVRESDLRYRIEIEIVPKSGMLRVADEFLAVLNKKGEISGKRSPFLEKIKGRFCLRMEGQADSADMSGDAGHSILSMPLYPPHYPHLTAVRQELASWLFFYFEPRERMRASNPVKETRHIGLMGEELAPFLNTLRALDEPQFRSVEKALCMMIPNITGIDVGPNDSGEVELKLMEGSIPIPASVLSEGTLRVLGLLALGGAKEPPALLGFEEPENGIHPRRIRMIADLLKNRVLTGNTQLIVTTHSPVLPDMFSDEELFVCRKPNGITEIEPFSAWKKTAYNNADHLLNAEQIPKASVSERILRGDFDA